MKDDKSRILPLLMDPRQPDENNRAYAYRILRKNIMNIQLQPGCQLSEAELSDYLDKLKQKKLKGNHNG